MNDEKGMHDFGTDKHYSVISFIRDYYNISYNSAIEKLILDFDIKKDDLDSVSNPVNIEKTSKNISISLIKADKPKFIECYFDEEEFDAKPSDSYSFAKIKNRISQNNFTRYNSINEIADEFIRGKTCIPSAIRSNANKNWKKQQVFCVDFDNKVDDKNICSCDYRHITEDKVLDYCKETELLPTIIYNTFSHSEKQHKFRLVYVLEEATTNIDVANSIISYLLKKFKNFNPDISKKNLTDMFLGGKNLYYISDNYYKAIVK